MSSLLPIHQALISVFNKSKVLNFAKSLLQYKIKLLSTENTAKILSNHEIPVKKISDYTKFPEIMNGRIKTLHHKIYAGILHKKKSDDDIMKKYQIKPIDMIIVDFYPFHEILKNKQYNSQKENILEYFDIGGPGMVRAAIKNYKNTVTIVDDHDYENILNELNKNNGTISLSTRLNLAAKALQHIIKYDTEISYYFEKKLSKVNTKKKQENKKSSSNNSFPNNLKCINLNFIKVQNMRYGENPHQDAALYKESNIESNSGSVATATQIQGKKLSYNNIIDMETALECVKIFDEPTCVIVKHENPCGVSTADTISEAYKKAHKSDPISAFGGIVAFNRDLDIKTAKIIIEEQHFIEAIIAPNMHHDCLKILSNKKNIRILCSGIWTNQECYNLNLKKINQGLLIQDQDKTIKPNNLKIVTVNQPSTQEIQDALFCWKIVKFVKSNAIVCGKNLQTTGIGSGQTNRVNSVRIATTPVLPQKLCDTQKLLGSVMASDAFFTFPDGIHIAAKAGIRCIIQPGGSIKDSEIIKTADKYKISMIFTNVRHFRH